MLKNTKLNLKSTVIPAKRSVSGNQSIGHSGPDPESHEMLNRVQHDVMAQSGRSTTLLSFPCLTRESIGRGLNVPHYTRSAQYGRSMVEILGVLAVMGVLSVGGVAMYTSAMNKHRANEILNEASKRAVVVAGQAMAGKTGTISLSEFGNNTVSGASFGTEAKVENNQIKLTLSGVESSICTKMKAALGDNTVMAVDDDCTIIAFNADMTKGVTKPTSCNPACTGGKECVNGTCECPNDKSFWNGNECEAKKTCASDEYYWPQLNHCSDEVDCGDADSELHNNSFAGRVDVNDEEKTCACPTGTTPYLDLNNYSFCCPNNMNLLTDITGYGVQECCHNNMQLICVYVRNNQCMHAVCCPPGSIYDLDGGCTPCSGGQQGLSSNGGYPICQCATGYHFDYDDVKDCVPD